MAGTAHKDSSTDVSDSSTDVSGDEGVAGSTNIAKAPARPLKRPAEPLPSTTPAKRAKNPEDGNPSASISTKEPPNALDFLKWRPQIAAMNSMRKAVAPTAAPQSLQSAKAGPTPTIHDLNSIQRAESLFDNISASTVDRDSDSWEQQHETITRKMGPYRDQVEIDLLNTATRHDLNSGKWMLFPMADDLPLVWRLVAEATAAGKLGPCSKVGTWEPDHVTKPTVICVYTKDFSDLADVKRVLSNLNELNIVNKAAKIVYKCDAYTHLSIMSDNPYKLRASLYSSDEVCDNKVKYKDGVITRLKTKNGAVGEFLNA
ncbi:hypothetical protein Q7P35_008449 [Cladosporium inversicolor]